MEQIYSSTNGGSKEKTTTNEGPTRLKTRIGWRKTTSERMAQFEIVRDTTSPHLPPWKGLECLTTDKVPLTKPKDEYSEEELFLLSMEKITSLYKLSV